MRDDKRIYLDMLWKDLLRLPVEDAMYVLNWKFENITTRIKTQTIYWWFTISEEKSLYIKVEAKTPEEAVEKVSQYMLWREPAKSIRDTNLLELE